MKTFTKILKTYIHEIKLLSISRFILIGIAIFLLTFLVPTKSYAFNWQQIFSDDFNRSLGAIGNGWVGANTTTNAEITSPGTLNLKAVGNNPWISEVVLRPTSENKLNQRTIATVLPNATGSSFWFTLRTQSPNLQYTFGIISNTIYISVGTTILTSSALTTGLNSAHSYQVEATATGTNPTTLTYIITDLNTFSVVGTATATDSWASLQQAGQFGMYAYSGNINVSSYTTYQDVSPSNQSPVANAGQDQTITLPTSSVTLNGSGTDSDGTISSYAWTKLSGSGTITSASSASTTVTGLTAGTSVFRLTVTDNQGATGTDDVNVAVNAGQGNQAPVVNAGTDQTITLPTSSVTVAGSATDPENNSMTYAWTKVSGGTATITSPASLSTTITGLAQGTYTFWLTATDSLGASNADAILITVNPASTTTQTLISVNSWNAYVKLPSNYSSNPSTYYPTIIFIPGLGEIGTNASLLLANGPSKFLNSGWDGAVTVDGVSIQPIIISLQPPSAYPVESLINTRIQTLKSLYRIDSNKLYLTGLSMGGWASLTFVTGDAYDSTPPYGPFTYASQIAAVVGVASVKPDDNSPYPNLFDNYARAGGRLLGFEQSQDFRDTQTYVNRMNSVVSNSAIFKATSFGDGSHCCFDSFYSPSATFSGLDGRTESIYQWMLRQQLGSSPPPPSNTPPTASAGSDQTITLPTSSAVLSGSGSDPGGSISSYAWTKLSGTGGTITSPTLASTTVTGLSAGSYTFRLTVTDNLGATGTDDVVVTVNTSVAGAKTVVLTTTANGEIYRPDLSSYNILPGDTIAIPAGTYNGGITIGGFYGNLANPITIINQGGQVQTQYLRISNGEYFKLTGSGSSHQYGIKVIGFSNAGVAIGAHTSDYEVERIEVTNVEAGFMFKVNPTTANTLTIYPNYVTRNVKIHDNYIYTVQGECMYIGHTYPNADPYSGNLTPIRMDNVKIYNNTVDGCGWDGIQLSNARTNAEIYNNTVKNTGTSDIGSQQAGIIIGGNTNGKVYNNIIENARGNALELFGYGDLLAYENIIKNAPLSLTQGSQDTVYFNDNNATTNIETNPNQRIYFTNNVVTTSTTPTQRHGVLNARNNGTTLPGSISNNTFCDSSGKTANQLIWTNASDTVSGNILNGPLCAGGSPPTNQFPIANAGSDQTITLPTSSVTLAGSATDSDGTITTHSWTQVSGPTATITIPSSYNSTITGLTTIGTYIFRLTATDNNGANAADDVNITVNPAGTPTPISGGGGGGGSPAPTSCAIGSTGIYPNCTRINVNQNLTSTNCSGGQLFNPTTGARCAGASTPSGSIPSTTIPSTGIRKTNSLQDKKSLQIFLNWILNTKITPLVVDGKWGAKTTTAIRLYQSQNGLKVDGTFGKLSAGKARELMGVR